MEIPVTKRCTKCLEIKGVGEFGLRKRTTNKPPRPSSLCKKCAVKKSTKQNQKNKEEINRHRRERRKEDPVYAERLRVVKNESRLKNIEAHMARAAQTRSIKKGLEFSITKEDIIIPEICPILGIPIIFGTKDDYEQTPSLDRIDNSKGYSKDNIQVISKKANSMKNSGTPEELIKLADWIYKTFK